MTGGMTDDIEDARPNHPETGQRVVATDNPDAAAGDTDIPTAGAGDVDAADLGEDTQGQGPEGGHAAPPGTRTDRRSPDDKRYD